MSSRQNKIFFVTLFFIFPYSSIAANSYDDVWTAYQVKHNKKYLAKEGVLRKSIFEQNAEKVARHNLEVDFGLHSFRLELNKFSDKTDDEVHNYRKCLKRSGLNRGRNSTKMYNSYFGKSYKSILPSFVDWRKKGLVTLVKDQGNCGSCWAFSATGSLEGQTKKKTGSLVSLSEQNLVDCSYKQGNDGCDGGWMESAFKYVIDNGGIDTEKVYKYKGRNGRCKFKRNGIGANCTNYHMIKQGSETDLQSAVANIGPISIAIDASSDKFMHYKNGVYYDSSCTSTELDHAVLIVGYGTENGQDYWIVKNSWGTDWGMNGYILMSRNKRNQCGIASHAVYPIV